MGVERPCEWGSSPIDLVEVTAADRAAATLRGSTGKGEFRGRGRFSKRSASPPDPLSRRVAGNRLVCSFGVERPCECGSSPIDLVEVTAADRAAATLQGAPTVAERIILSQSSADSSLCGGSLLVCTALRSSPNAGRSRRLCQPPWPQPPRKEPRPPHRRNRLCRSTHLKRQPLFGRGGLGRGRFSQRSGLSPRVLHPTSLRKGARGRGLLAEKPSPSQLPSLVPLVTLGNL